MSVIIDGVQKKSPAKKAGIKAGDILVALGGNEIIDVLDYRFYQFEKNPEIEIIRKGKKKTVRVKKDEEQDLGLEFSDYLMDKQRSCKNNCIFCFIDQLPKGLRETLYFKDDDSRLSFLFGNYITLTNLTEHEISRIIKLHISPVNISVHTTNPILRCKMMNNRFAGETLSIIKRFDDAGIKMNFQLVLVPGYNDGAELERSLETLSEHKNALSIASVPVGLTRYREGLTKIEPFGEQTSKAVLEITEKVAAKNLEKYGERKVFAADEFYLKAKWQMPRAEEYGEYNQLDNGVGMWSLFEEEAAEALDTLPKPKNSRRVTAVTGIAAEPLIKSTVDKALLKWDNLDANVIAIKNEFFGEEITVAGLVTGRDIINQLKDKEIAEEILIPSSMLRFERDLFLDSVSVEQVEKELGVKVTVTEVGGFDFVEALRGGENNG